MGHAIGKTGKVFKAHPDNAEDFGWRLDLLKVVGSSPACFAKPEGDVERCTVKRSRAAQMSRCENMENATR